MNMFLKILVVISVFLITQTSAARILVILGCPSYSHHVALKPIWQELSRRGHDVTLASPDSVNEPALINLTEISMHDTYYISEVLYLYTQIPKAHSLKVLDLVNESFDAIIKFQMSKYLKNLINNKITFDVVIVEHLFPEYLAFGDFFKSPTILISSFDVTSLTYEYLGNPTNAVIYPDVTLPFAEKLNFGERLVSFIFQYAFYLYKSFIKYPIRKNILKTYFGEDVRNVEQLYNDIDLMLVNTNPITSAIRPILPNTISFGSGNHLMPPKELPQDLKIFLDNATEGCIYFSLGTNSKSIFMGMKKIQIILQALSELPYQILWKFEAENMIDPPKNVKLILWAPQQDILRHPNVKLFITQGGIQSLEESILCHVPMAMMPMYGDQEANAKRLENKGLVKVIPHKPLPNKDEFKNIVLEVIQNPMYKQNIVKSAEILLDSPMNGVEKAVWWIEYVIRHKGAKHLRSPALDVPFYQYYFLDVIATILLVIYAFYKILLLICKLSFRLVCRSKQKKKIIMKKSQ